MNEELLQLMKDGKELADNLIIRCQTLCELFREMQYEEGQEKIIYLFEDIQSLAEAVVYLQIKNVTVDEMNEKLTLILEQIEERDFQLTADLIEFELQPLLQYWSENLTNVH